MTREKLSAANRVLYDELNFTTAMEELARPDVSGLDIEDALEQLWEVNTFTPPQARQVLSLAAQNVSGWIETAGATRTLQILQTGPISTLRQTQEGQQSAIDQPEVAKNVCQILAKMLAAEPRLYPRELAKAMGEGDFGQPAEVLVGILASLLPHRPDPEPDSTGELSVLALMLSDLAAYNDPQLIERIRTQLPVEWLLNGDEVLRRYPTVRNLLEEAWSTNDPKHQELASRLLRMGPENVEAFFKYITEKGKQPGVDAFDTLVKVLVIITAENKDQPVESIEGRDEAAEAIWIELLEINRTDPRLRPLRHRLISEEWYWDEESALFTLLDTFKDIGSEEGDELPFIKQHEKEILNAFSLRLDRLPHIYQEGLDRTAERGEFAERLQLAIAAFRKVPMDPTSVDQLTAHYPDELLFAALWTPQTPIRGLKRLTSASQL